MEGAAEIREPSLSDTLKAAANAAKRAYENDPMPDPSARVDLARNVYLQTRDWPWFRRQLEGMDPKTYLKRTYSIAESLIRDGHGDWVAKKLETFPFDPQSYEFGRLLTWLAAGGQAGWVVEHIPFPEPTHLSDRVQEFLATLCKSGQADWVVEHINAIDLSKISSLNRLILIVTLIRGGQPNPAVSLIDRAADELRPEDVRTLVGILVQNGLTDRAMPLLERMEPPKDQEEKDIFADIRRALSAQRDNPAVRAWLERQPDGDVDKHPSRDPRAFRFDAYTVNYAKESLRKADDKDRSRFREKIQAKLWISGVPDAERAAVETPLLAWADALSPLELPLAALAIDAEGTLSEGLARLIEFTRGNRAECVIEIHKTGSALFVYARRNPETKATEFTFVNDIPPMAAKTWLVAHQAGIPVAPILRRPVARKDGSVRVYSRYCGKTAFYYVDNIQIPKEFRDWLRDEITRVTDELLRRGIRHGHPHGGNFTVEFYRSEYYDRAREEGKNPNQIPYSQNDVTFDLAPYLERPDAWMPVVRLIDWDQATSPAAQTENQP